MNGKSKTAGAGVGVGTGAGAHSAAVHSDAAGKSTSKPLHSIATRHDSQEYWLEQSRPPVGRAEVKLEGAIKTFKFNFKDKVVLDIGSSTGGFTELALKNGAKKVIAIEKGTNQMKSPLRDDKRVNLREKTDIFTVKRASFDERVDVILADVSFVSLKKVLEYVRRELIEPGETELIVMLKPQFEARPEQLLRGVIKNEKVRRVIIKDFENWLRTHGFVIVAKHDSDLPGRYGNLERFYWLKISTTFLL